MGQCVETPAASERAGRQILARNDRIPLLIGVESSIFCEKARFALDYKRLPYREKKLLPGLHRWTVRRYGGTGTVPVMRVASASAGGEKSAMGSSPPASAARSRAMLIRSASRSLRR